MVTKEFILELTKVLELYEWSISPGDPLYGERRTTPRRRIRGTLRSKPNGLRFEPIGAVCLVRTGMEFGEDYWVEAAISIGLSLQDARDIVSATNDVTWRTTGEQREPDPYKEALRQWLLEATGLHVSLAAEASMLSSGAGQTTGPAPR